LIFIFKSKKLFKALLPLKKIGEVFSIVFNNCFPWLKKDLAPPINTGFDFFDNLILSLFINFISLLVFFF